MHIANYKAERDILERVIGDQTPERTIFLSGESEYGKTWLLDWLEQQYGKEARIVRVNLFEPDSEMNPALAMSQCIGKLGWDHFSEFKEVRARRPVSQANIENVRSIGNNVTFTAAANPPSVADQLVTAMELTDAFVKGLSRAASAGPPIVICLDGYCRAAPPIPDWVEQALIDYVTKAKCARLIITRRKPADPKLCYGADALAAIELRGVADVGEWARVADELGRALPGEDAQAALEVAISVTEGVPGPMMRWLQRLSSSAQA
jgi:hypothetical protein